MTDDELDARLADAGARWREHNAEAAAIDLAAVASAAEDDTTDDTAGTAAGTAASTDPEPLPLVPDAPPPGRRRRTRALLAAAVGVAAAVAAAVLAVQLSGGSSGGNHHAAQGGTPLVGTDWQLVATAQGAVPTGTNATLRITSGGELSGNDGCNAFGGRVSVSADTLVIGRVMHTMMGCLGANGTVGQAVDAVLSGGTVRYAIDADTLTITKDGAGTLTYTVKRNRVTPAVTDPAALEVGDWKLDTIQLGDNIAQPYGTSSSAPPSAQLKFAVGRLVGNDGCNSFTAKVNLGPGTIAVTGFTDTTTNPCPTSSDWTLVLQGATHWQLAGDRLTISDDHNGRLQFTKVADLNSPPAATATK
jgi:heat shock protein HslJ